MIGTWNRRSFQLRLISFSRHNIYFYNIFIARIFLFQIECYSRVVSSYHVIQITRVPLYEESCGQVRLPSAVSRKSDNFAGQLRYRAVQRGTGETRRADIERKEAGGQIGA